MRGVTFGEVMLRLAPEEFLRIRQVVSGQLEVAFGCGELNVAVSVAQQGGRSAFVTSVPDNVLTDALLQEMHKLNVDTDLVFKSPSGRFGIYLIETGANQRSGSVTFDSVGGDAGLIGVAHGGKFVVCRRRGSGWTAC